eukprot:UN00539
MKMFVLKIFLKVVWKCYDDKTYEEAKNLCESQAADLCSLDKFLEVTGCCSIQDCSANIGGGNVK